MSEFASEVTDVSDLRDILYSSYRSSFKAIRESPPKRGSNSQAAAFDYFFDAFLVDLPRTAAILELGCGDGAFLVSLQSKGFLNASGVDRSLEQAQAALARGASVQAGDLFDVLQKAPRTFDAIFALDVIEHLTKAELVRWGRLVRAALKPGGLLVIQTPNGEGVSAGRIIFGDLTHETIFTASSLGQYLRAFGFTDLQFRETGPVPLSFPGRVRWIAWRMLRLGVQLATLAQTGACPTILTSVLISACRAPAVGNQP